MQNLEGFQVPAYKKKKKTLEEIIALTDAVPLLCL